MEKSKIERTRALILDSAKKILIENGYKNTTIKMIAAHAGLGYGTIYSHFKLGKDEILSYLIEDIMDPFYSIAELIYTPKNKEEAFMFTYSNIYNYLKLADENREILSLIEEAKEVSPLIHASWEGITEKFVKRVSSNVSVVRQLGLIRNEQYNEDIISGILCYTGERYLWKIVQGTTSIPIEEIARDIATMYTHGLFK